MSDILKNQDYTEFQENTYITSVCPAGVKDSEEEDEEEEENNTSPVKRPASLKSGNKPPLVATSAFLNSFSYRSAFSCEKTKCKLHDLIMYPFDSHLSLLMDDTVSPLLEVEVFRVDALHSHAL